MAWPCYMLAVVAVVFSGSFQTVYSDGNNITLEKITCQTAECISKAEAMTEKMNLSADPCDDFNEFACGRFLKNYVLPPGKIFTNAYGDRDDENQFIMHDVLVNTTSPTRPEYVKIMQRLFYSCMNETQIENVGLAPYFNDRTFVDDWPTLNPRWSDAGFDFNEVIARYIIRVSPIFVVTVSQNMTDQTKHAIELTQPTFEMGKSYFMKNRNDSVIKAYERYMAERAVALNASRGVAERDARDVVDLEIELARISVPEEQQRDTTKQNNPIKLSQLSKVYPRLDIARAIRSTFSAVNITLSDDEVVMNSFPQYIKDVESVLECFPNRTIQNLFGFKYAFSRVSGLTQQMRNYSNEFNKAYLGTRTEQPRWKTCLTTTASTFPMGMSKLFVGRVFSETAKNKLSEMIDELKEVFGDMIKEATWMSNATKSEAFKKLAVTKKKVGYPDSEFEDADIDRLYENYTISADNFYDNQVFINNLTTLNTLAALRKPVDKSRWSLPPYQVNAYSNQLANEIALLAGILLPPFYSETSQDYLNYGAIGYIIGHEITHLFDDMGKRYDEVGNLRNWWTAEDQAKFVNRSQCIVDQVSNFYVDDINMYLDGAKSQGESEGDTAGLKESFRAYTKHILKYNITPEWLPNVNFTHDQLFFVSMAQLYCQVSTPEVTRWFVTSTPHPLAKFRIIGTLQNSEEFARVYNCPLGSYMNPVKKCGVW